MRAPELVDRALPEDRSGRWDISASRQGPGVPYGRTGSASMSILDLFEPLRRGLDGQDRGTIFFAHLCRASLLRGDLR